MSDLKGETNILSKNHIEWKDSFNIGVEQIDCQHRQLLSRINDLFEACANHQGKEKIEETLGFLKEYTIEHFGSEEQLMESIDFPHLNEQRKQHAEFVKAILELEQQVKTNGVSVLSTIKLNRTLVNWLVQHIQKCDQLIGDCASKKKAQ